MQCKKCDCLIVPSHRYIVAKGHVIEKREDLQEALRLLDIAEKEFTDAMEADNGL